MLDPAIYHHNRCPSEEVYGQKLEKGDTIDRDDVCEAPSGKWVKCTNFHGECVTSTTRTIIRRLPVWSPLAKVAA